MLAPDHLKATLVQKGVKVGGSAQITAALGVNFKPFKGFRIGADWVVAANNYSDYSISTSQFENGGEVVVSDPWKLPWGNELDLSASYNFKIAGLNATIYGNVYNVFNYFYLKDATTPSNEKGSWQNAYGFYSLGRRFSLRLKISF